MTPDDIDVWVGLDVGKSAHHAHALDHDGNTLYDKPLKQDEKAIRTMLGKPDVYLEVQHPCWSCNSNSSSANASAGVR